MNINLKDLSQRLNFSIKIPKDDTEIESKAHETALGVSAIHQSARNRTYLQIKEDCFYGTAREVGVARLGSGVVNHQEPDFVSYDRSTFGWDVQIENLRLEIKPHTGKYFSVSKSVRQKLINNQSEYDAIVSVEVRDVEDCVEIIPRLIIPSECVETRHFRVSKFNNNQYYYDHFNGPCYELNKDIV